MAVTPTSFKAAKPQFAAVADPTVQAYLDLAARVVGEGWLAADVDAALTAYTCHLMTLEGLGTDAASVSFAKGTAEFQTVKSGELTLTRFRSSQPVTTSYSDWLSSTQCGRFFLMLAKMNRGGPRQISITTCPPSPYAKDWPHGFA